MEFQMLWKQIEHMKRIFSSPLTVEKKMYEKAAFTFVYSEEVKFSNRSDFLQFFADHKTIFFSNISTDYPALLPSIALPESQDRILTEKIFHLSKVPSILKAIETAKTDE